MKVLVVGRFALRPVLARFDFLISKPQISESADKADLLWVFYALPPVAVVRHRGVRGRPPETDDRGALDSEESPGPRAGVLHELLVWHSVP
jgi:hypothetical protein